MKLENMNQKELENLVLEQLRKDTDVKQNFKDFINENIYQIEEEYLTTDTSILKKAEKPFTIKLSLLYEIAELLIQQIFNTDNLNYNQYLIIDEGEIKLDIEKLLQESSKLDGIEGKLTFMSTLQNMILNGAQNIDKATSDGNFLVYDIDIINLIINSYIIDYSHYKQYTYKNYMSINLNKFNFIIDCLLEDNEDNYCILDVFTCLVHSVYNTISKVFLNLYLLYLTI